MNNLVTIPWVVKSIEDQGIFKGYASVFNTLDDQGDRVAPGAFKQSLTNWQQKNALPKMLWQHDQGEPIGWWKTIHEDQHGLYVEGQLLLSLLKGREAYEMLKNAMIDKLSIGCRVIEAGHGEQGPERWLKTLDLLEISLVTFAANTDTHITLVKNQKPGMTALDVLTSLNHAQQALRLG